LSAITVLLIFAGGLARVFTSVQETGDFITVFTYMVSSACSGLLAFQVAYYWKSTAKQQTKKVN
jgi:mannose-P-dolichol utilization defect protein 1